MYARTLIAGWADMDYNAHMRNTAFLDKAADVRMMFFADHGFPMDEFARVGLGPVVMKDEVEYFREVRLLQEITVTLALAGLADDGSRFLIRNEVLRADGRLCARINSLGAWLDRTARKAVAPPPALLSTLRLLARTGDYTSLPSRPRDGT